MPKFTSPEELERKFVQNVYHDIAPGFRHTRYKAWPYVEQFLKSQPAGSIIADVGCGNGKYLGLTTDSFIMGSDTCLKLVEIAHDRHHEVAVCNNLRLPYRDECFDAVISIGVIHHFASAKRRLRALQELGRILRPGGKMLVYVWAMEQQQRKFDAQDVLVPYTGHQRFRAKRRKSIHKNNNFPDLANSLAPNGHSNLRRSKSCDKLFDRCQSTGNSKHFDPESNNTEGHAISSNIEFKVLKEIIQTIKNKKDHLITNLNAQVTKLYPEKEKKFVDGLLSGLIGRFFDKNKNTPSRNDSPNDKPNPAQGVDTQNRITNVTKFVSSLVKRLFNEKNDETMSTDKTEQAPHEIQQVELMKISEKDLKESFYISLTAWAKEKINVLSFRERKEKVKPRALLLRGESCDSEYSEVDSEEYQLAASTACFLEPDGKNSAVAVEVQAKCPNADSKRDKTPPHLLTRLLIDSISSSSDSDSDGSLSSSVDRVNTDSGISDSEPQETLPSSANGRRRAYTTSCYENKYSAEENIADGEKKQHKLQRYYHVFNQKELPDLIEDGVDGVDVLKEYYDHGNWAVIAEKQ